MKKLLVLFSLMLILLAAPPAIASKDSARTVKGPNGQTLRAEKTRLITDGTMVLVTGKGYDSKVGIYVTYCVVPKKGVKPSQCGSIDVTGQNNSSIWVSSDAPFIAAFLAKPFSRGGSFKHSIKVSRKIGDADCKKVRCAIVTRADHTNPNNRKADVLIPVTIK